jgi:hypothetical protein
MANLDKRRPHILPQTDLIIGLAVFNFLDGRVDQNHEESEFR